MSETTSIILKNTSNQLVMGDPSFLGPTTTFSAVTPSASRTITIPDAGANSSLLLSAGSNTISGSQTFSSAINLTAASNQVVVQPGGSGTTDTLNFVQPASSSRVITFPDPLANANVIYDVLAQTLSGAKTFSSTVVLTPSSNQISIVPGGGLNPQFNITASAPAANRNITIADPLGNDTLAYLAATQSLSNKTVTGPMNVIHVTATVAVTAAQSGSTIFIDSSAAAVSITLPTIAAGLKYKFIVTSSSLASAVTIVAPSANQAGLVIAGDATAFGTVPFSAKTNVILGTGSKLGDTLNYECDGTNYWISGFIAVHSTITLS